MRPRFMPQSGYSGCLHFTSHASVLRECSGKAGTSIFHNSWKVMSVLLMFLSAKEDRLHTHKFLQRFFYRKRMKDVFSCLNQSKCYRFFYSPSFLTYECVDVGNFLTT